MNIPDSYNPLETMEKLLPAIAGSLGLSIQDLIKLTVEELSPEQLQQSPLERMQKLSHDMEQCQAQYNSL